MRAVSSGMCVPCLCVMSGVYVCYTTYNQMASCDSIVPYYSFLANYLPQKTLTEKYKPNKQQRKARLSAIIKGFIWEI